MPTVFHQLNHDWNADPNAPLPAIKLSETALVLTFQLNAFQFTRFSEGDQAMVVFRDCWRYRLGPTNDEGWYRGQCRFSEKAPNWGEFYEVQGDLLMEVAPPWNGKSIPLTWSVLSEPPPERSRHFLFYFRDKTFECDATDWELILPK